MPRTKDQNMALRRQRKEEILQSALRVYVEKGYAASDITEIAQQAGIGKGLVHYYFKDKATLFRELFTAMLDKSNEHVQSIFNEQGSVLNLFERYAASMYQSIFENREIVLFFLRMGHELKMVFSEEEIKQLKWPSAYMQVISETLNRGMKTGEIRIMSPQLLAMQFTGALFHGLSHLIRSIENQEGDTKYRSKSIAQDIQDATSSCLAILRADGKSF